MARFKKRSVRRALFRAKRTGRRSSTSGSPMKLIIPALVYGAGRQYVSKMAAPIVSKIPLGNYAENALFGAAGYYAAKKGSGMVREIGKAVLVVEAASVGHQVVSGMTGGTSTGASW